VSSRNPTDRREVLWVEHPADELPPAPTNADEARARLNAGSIGFARIGDVEAGRVEVAVGPEAFGLPRTPGEGLPQEPFVAVLGCSDARVPVELVLGQAANDIFVVRVAGNVPGTECIGSLLYATAHMPSVQLLAVLGHSQCGAVTAAADALLAPETYLEIVHEPPLRAIIDALFPCVQMAALALEDVHGPTVRTDERFRAALISVSIVANAAVTATMLDRGLDREVAFGVFDLEQRTVGVGSATGWAPGLVDAPTDDTGLASLLAGAAGAAL
jgi:carbonic anhydrase